MITGYVDARRRPVVSLTIHGPQGQETITEFMVDSGFNGELALPLKIVTALGLLVYRLDYIVLANGQQIEVVTYEASVAWGDSERRTLVFATGDQPLLGTAALLGYRFCMDTKVGGPVSIVSL